MILSKNRQEINMFNFLKFSKVKKIIFIVVFIISIPALFNQINFAVEKNTLDIWFCMSSFLQYIFAVFVMPDIMARVLESKE